MFFLRNQIYCREVISRCLERLRVAERELDSARAFLAISVPWFILSLIV